MTTRIFTWCEIALATLAVVMLCALVRCGYEDKVAELEMQQFAAGNWTPISGYYRYNQFVSDDQDWLAQLERAGK